MDLIILIYIQLSEKMFILDLPENIISEFPLNKKRQKSQLKFKSYSISHFVICNISSLSLLRHISEPNMQLPVTKS